MERLEYDLLFRWFVGLGVDDRGLGPFEPSPRTATGCWRARSPPSSARGAGPAEGQAAAVGGSLLGRRHADRGLGLDEELPAARMAATTTRRAGATPSATSIGRSAPTRPMPSTTDPEARLYRKGDGQPAKLCYMGHVLMENRHGLAVDGRCHPGHRHGRAGGGAGDARTAGAPSGGGSPLGADKAYDVRQLHAGPARRVGHAAHRHRRPCQPRPASRARPPSTAAPPVTPATPSASAAASASRRCSAGSRASAGLAKVKLRGRRKVDAAFTLALAAYNLVRLPKLLGGAGMSLLGKWRIVEDAGL